MTPLKEFANLITGNMTALTAVYIQLLAESQPGYEAGLIEQRPISPRRQLQTVVTALEQRSAQPLMALFEQQVTEPVMPLLLIETLSKTLTPLAPSLEAGRFLWQSLSEVRASLLRPVSVPVCADQPSLPNNITAHVAGLPSESRNGLARREPQPAPIITATNTLKQDANVGRLLADFGEEDAGRAVLSIARLAQVELTMESTLVDLPVYSFQVEADTLVREVEKLLREYTILPGVIITQNENAVGVISRRKFFEQLGQLYGVAVFMRRPIRLMLDKINAEPLLLPAGCSVPEAVDLVLKRPPAFVFEPVIVEVARQTYRLLDVYTLLMAQSKLFSALQSRLQVANIELEKRVERRTAELVRANADLTDEVQKRREAEAALIVARDQALAASRFKSELLAKISHELRTPLGAIIGHTEMIQVGIYGTVTEKQDQVAAKIIDNANYLTKLVSQLLDQAQYEAGKLQLNVTTFAPNDLLENSISQLGMVAQNKGLALQTKISAELPSQLAGDPVRLQQILINLVGNAVRYTEHGRVDVRLYCPDDQHWAIEVADTGPGISPENQSRIFEPFGQANVLMTRRHAGIGLGLSIVKQITVLMGGRINLDSQIGRGSIFTVTLPIEPRE